MLHDEIVDLLKKVQTSIAKECCGTVLDNGTAVHQLETVIQALSFNPGKRRVVAAANLFPSGKMLVSARHWDPLMHKQAKWMGIDRKEDGMEVQGFIDQYRQFMTREEAWTVANEAGQIIRRCGGDEGCLYSENIC